MNHLHTYTPISLKRILDADTLYRSNACDTLITLGSYWPNSNSSYESHIVKSFKECNPTSSFEPHISALCRSYAHIISNRVQQHKINRIARILSSSEREPEDSRPLSLLSHILCAQLDAVDISYLFFKSELRPPMRSIKRLSGPDALKGRIQYVLQDLFIKPGKLGGRVLLIDDIYNLGASMQVYASALKQFAGAEYICGVNLAATRFAQGKDGHGTLKLDTTEFANISSMDQAWIDANQIFHQDKSCPQIEKPTTCKLRFLAEQKSTPCKECIGVDTPQKKWWQLWK